MFWLKSCPRCRGDVAAREDIYGKDVLCIQCGHRLRPQEIELLLGGTRRRAGAPQLIPSRRRKSVQTASQERYRPKED